ncbi:homeobox protein orthopedia [Phthorimaea operculella]|nr:homeobox protein orthopedia [Phthorimaea operculella]
MDIHVTDIFLERYARHLFALPSVKRRVWFQNRRAKWRKQARLQLLQDAWRMRCLGLGSPPLPMPGHAKPPDSSPEGGDSPTGKDSPEPPTTDNTELKTPHQETYLHNNMPENHPNMPPHEIPPPYGSDERFQQFPFPPLLMQQPMESEIGPTDLRVLPPKNCPCTPQAEEPQNLAYRREDDNSDSDAEIDLTSHSKDDDLRESERLANRIATSMFRSDTVLHDLVPNDLSLAKNGVERNVKNLSSI